MRITGISLVAAALLFWLSWLLMPGVGVTDAEQIFRLVAAQRPLVAASVVMQLISAVLYVPALLGIVSDAKLGVTAARRSAGLLLVGAMGSAADAVLHLLAYAMTMPGLEIRTLVRVMAFMQGPGLLLLAPLILCFFLGGAGLSLAFARIRLVSRWNLRLHGIALAVAVIGGPLATREWVASRAVGLITLGLISAAQAWIGIAMWMGRAKKSGI
ncbi:MAG: hypothetical protein U0Z53_01985 [Blastocatellia bacterium]